MIQHKILKHVLSLFFVLVLLTVFATQWNAAEDRKEFLSESPSAGPEELLRTLEKIPGTKDSQQSINTKKVNAEQNVIKTVPESYMKFSGAM